MVNLSLLQWNSIIGVYFQKTGRRESHFHRIKTTSTPRLSPIRLCCLCTSSISCPSSISIRRLLGVCGSAQHATKDQREDHIHWNHDPAEGQHRYRDLRAG